MWLTSLIRMAAKAVQQDFAPKWPIKPVELPLFLDPSDGEGYIPTTGFEAPKGDMEQSQCTILGFPTLRQAYTYSCGANVLSMIMHFYGFDELEKDVMDAVKTTENGTTIVNMVIYLRNNGFQVVEKSSNLEEVRDWIKKGFPVILNLQAWPDDKVEGWQDSYKNGHYVVAIGFTDKHVICSDPSSIYDTYLTNEELERRWHDEDTNNKIYKNYIIVPYGKKPVYEHNRIMPMG